MTRRPMDGARKNNGDTAEHAAYGVGPATDYGADSGEPIFAPFAGRAGGWWSSTGGNVVQVVGNGVTFVGQHLSSRAVGVGAAVKEGDVIGYIGSTGSATTGPHLHWWIEDSGTRISGETYMHRVGLGYTPYGSRTPVTSTAGGETTPIVEPPKRRKKSMSTLYYTKRGTSNEWALGGDSPGTPANWITTASQTVANELAAVHGASVALGNKSFDVFAGWYLSPVSTSGGTPSAVSVDLAPVLTEIGKIPALTRDEFAKKPLS